MAVSVAGRLNRGALLGLLSDGAHRSGAELARELPAGDGDLAQLLGGLAADGIEIIEEPPDGYRLACAVELLDAARIRAALSPRCRSRLHRLDVPFETDSTSTWILERAPPPRGAAHACLCEIQRAGRGRRGRSWSAPFGGSIALSLGWSAAAAERVDPSLSLAVGVAVARALKRSGARGIGLKWPNDVWLDERKLGGVLVELRTEAGGPAHLAIGIGLNVSLSPGARRSIEAQGARIAALAEACREPPSRNALAASLLEELIGMLERFEESGFAAFRDEWLALDALWGRPARVLAPDGAIDGTARGVDADGALLFDVGGRSMRFASGEVSLRPNEGDA